MGQRKKSHKFFRWMRQSALPEPVADTPPRTNHRTFASPPGPLSPSSAPLSVHPPTSDSNPPPATSSDPQQIPPTLTDGSPPSQPHARPASIALQQQQTPPAQPNGTSHQRRQAPPDAIILRVKELTAHQCFTQQSLRRIYVQPPAGSTAPAASTTTDEARVAPNETAHSAAPSVDRHHHQHRETLPPLRCPDAQPHHLTERRAVAKSALRPLLQTLAESPAHTTAAVAVVAVEKTVSCRLYDCILPAACTTRNASSEPPESRAPSVLKLDLTQQQQQPSRALVHGTAAVSSQSSNINSIGRSAQLSKKKFLLEVMDRSVDSIGSCSLDVDAESTDFSDTSGSLNLCTPSSGKDFTREFTSRIHERCQLGLISNAAAQRTTTILDPASGKIRTVLTAATVIEADVDSDPSLDSPAKKPSYLNLACCVNGYSNLTTYDSKLRQNINRSREVSPIRPITHTLQYSRHGADSNGGQYLVVPVPMPIINDSSTRSDAGRVSTKTAFAAIKTTAGDMNRTGADCTDFKSTPASGLTPVRRATTATAEHAPESPKSFIQQRVERLYGPSALAAGFYSPKRSNGGAPTDGASILAERSLNAVNTGKAAGSNGHHHSGGGGGGGGSSSSASKLFKTDYHLNGARTGATENAAEPQSLPVLRHLRPEFRAQLPIVASPKRSPPAKQGGAAVPLAAVAANGAATTARDSQQHQHYQQSSYKHSNGALHTNTTAPQHPHATSSSTHNGSSTQPQPTHVGTAHTHIDVGAISLERRAALDARASTTTTSPPNGSSSAPATTTATATAVQSSASATHQSNSNTPTVVLASNCVDDYEQQPNSNNGTTANSGGSGGGDDDECDDVSVNTTVSVVRSMKITDDSTAVTAAPKLANGGGGVGGGAAAAQHARNGNGHMADEEAAAIVVPVPAEANVPTGGSVCYTNGHHNGAAIATAGAVTNGSAVAASASSPSSSVKDGLYFLVVMNVERERLIALAVTAEQYMDGLAPDVDEEIVGHLRSAAGKARLLATQKIRQFEGLCHNNLNQVPGEKFPTTNEDLQGFWDMVMLQVYNVDDLFRDIERYHANNWEKLPVEAPSGPPTGSRLTKRPMGRGGVAVPPKSATSASNGEVAAKKSAVAAAAAQRREAQRKQLLEMKRRAKMQQQQQPPTDGHDAVLLLVDDATTNGISNGSTTIDGIAAATESSS